MIVKHKQSANFSILPNSIAADKELSFRAKGILWYCLSKPENWKVIVEDLISTSPKEGRDAIRSAIQEIADAGYAFLEVVQGEKGLMNGREWIVTDEKSADKNAADSTEALKNRLSVKPSDGKTDTNKDLHFNKNKKEKRKSQISSCMEIEIPVELDTHEFRQTWIEWIEFRLTEKRPPFKPEKLFLRQLRTMKQWGVQASIDSMKRSMLGGWEGLFQDKAQKKPYMGPNI